MINNSEKILKGLGTTVLCLGIVASLIMGIVFLAQGYGFWVPLGLIVLLGGSASALISGMALYGLGELIETNKEIARNTAPAPAYPAAPAPAYPAAPAPGSASGGEPVRFPDGSWKCRCGRINQSYVFSCACGVNKRELSFAPKGT